MLRSFSPFYYPPSLENLLYFWVARHFQQPAAKLGYPIDRLLSVFLYNAVVAAYSLNARHIVRVLVEPRSRSFPLVFSSPGYGLFLTAETTEGVTYHGEAMSKPKGEPGDPIVAEDVGINASVALLEEIYRVGFRWFTYFLTVRRLVAIIILARA